MFSCSEKKAGAAASRRSWFVGHRWPVLLAQLVDGSGAPIDQGILETVIVLNVLEIPTTMSCEGHLDHGVAAPWVDIEPPGAGDSRRQISKLQRQANQDFAPGIPSPLSDEAEAVYDLLKRQMLELCRRVIGYLNEFYADRHVPYSQQLFLSTCERAGRARLESIGADLQAIEPAQVRRQLLGDYQEEMRAFTRFLTTRIEFLDPMREPS